MRLKVKAMPRGAIRSLLIVAVSSTLIGNAFSQKISGKPPAPTHVEPGMENAVKWKWRVDESDEKDWGLSTPTPSPTPVAVAVAAPTPEIRPTSYEIKRGDALILIARKFGMTVEQIKAFNGLKNDKIRAGQTLKIPTLAELSAMAPP